MEISLHFDNRRGNLTRRLIVKIFAKKINRYPDVNDIRITVKFFELNDGNLLFVCKSSVSVRRIGFEASCERGEGVVVHE